MQCKIKVWSRIGNTPVTGRVGAFCDELVSKDIDAIDHKDAIAQVKAIMKETPNSDRGFYHMPEYWNHNLAHGWV